MAKSRTRGHTTSTNFRTLIAGCMHATGGNANAAILLHETVRFQDISENVYQGKKWVGFTQSEWGVRTGLTKRQVAKATKDLRNLGAIEIVRSRTHPKEVNLNFFHVPVDFVGFLTKKFKPSVAREEWLEQNWYAAMTVKKGEDSTVQNCTVVEDTQVCA